MGFTEKINSSFESLTSYFKNDSEASTKLDQLEVGNENKVKFNDGLGGFSEKAVEKGLLGLAVGSFTAGLLGAAYLSRRKGSRLTLKPRLSPTNSHHANYPTPLATAFTNDPMQDARLFALKTFGFGTLLCFSVTGTLCLVTSYITGATSVKEFSHYMKAFVVTKILGKSMPKIGEQIKEQSDEELEAELDQAIEELNKEDSK